MRAIFVRDSVTLTQQEAGSLRAFHRAVGLEVTRIGWHGCNLGFELEAEVAPDTSVIGILANDSVHCRWAGARVDEAHVAASGKSIWLSTLGPSAFFSVTIDLPQLARALPNSPDARILIENAAVVRLDRNLHHAKRLRHHLRWLLRDSTKASGFLRPVTARAMIERTLLPLLADVFVGRDGTSIERSPSLNRRIAAVRACEVYMHEHLDSTVTLEDLSGTCGLRLRSLINAFQAVTGFSPMAYFKRQRLSAVRQALQLNEQSHTRVIDVATSWGFWHMGHFAADYREMFGEAPSETLRPP